MAFKLNDFNEFTGLQWTLFSGFDFEKHQSNRSEPEGKHHSEWLPAEEHGYLGRYFRTPMMDRLLASLLPASLLLIAAPPFVSQTTRDLYADTTFVNLTLAPPVMRFSQSSDLCAFLGGRAYAGFGASPAALGIPRSSPFGIYLSSQYANMMPQLNLPSLNDFSQTFAMTDLGGPGSRLGVGAGIRSMGQGTGRSVVEYSLGAGRRTDASGKVTQDLGVSLKAVTTEGIGAPEGTEPFLGLMADIGYLINLGGSLRAGATLENLGKGATGVRPMVRLIGRHAIPRLGRARHPHS
jgi:hypothetical protein